MLRLDSTWLMAKKYARKIRRGLGLDPFHGLMRSDYKRVWNRRARSEQGAMIGVQGSACEADLRSSAPHTLAMLQECVGIYPDDVVLEIGAGVGRVGRVIAPLCREWIGADVSENMLAHIRRRLRDLPNARTVPSS